MCIRDRLGVDIPTEYRMMIQDFEQNEYKRSKRDTNEYGESNRRRRRQKVDDVFKIVKVNNILESYPPKYNIRVMNSFGNERDIVISENQFNDLVEETGFDTNNLDSSQKYKMEKMGQDQYEYDNMSTTREDNIDPY